MSDVLTVRVILKSDDNEMTFLAGTKAQGWGRAHGGLSGLSACGTRGSNDKSEKQEHRLLMVNS